MCFTCFNLKFSGMSCLAAFPSMDAASVKPLAALLGFWVRYIVVDVDELDAPFQHAPDERRESHGQMVDPLELTSLQGQKHQI